MFYDILYRTIPASEFEQKKIKKIMWLCTQNFRIKSDKLPAKLVSPARKMFALNEVN